jgi:hypothetical protein
VLHLIGGGIGKALERVPAVGLQFRETWTKFGIPDCINIHLQSMYPFTNDDFLYLINLIVHNYRNNNSAPVKYSYEADPATGYLTIRVEEVIAEVPAFDETIPEPGDAFPYDFYRGLGLIDEEGMVTIPSILGPVRIPMTREGAKEYLLSYKPDTNN